MINQNKLSGIYCEEQINGDKKNWEVGHDELDISQESAVTCLRCGGNLNDGLK